MSLHSSLNNKLCGGYKDKVEQLNFMAFVGEVYEDTLWIPDFAVDGYFVAEKEERNHDIDGWTDGWMGGWIDEGTDGNTFWNEFQKLYFTRQQTSDSFYQVTNIQAENDSFRI